MNVVWLGILSVVCIAVFERVTRLEYILLVSFLSVYALSF